MEIVKNKNIVLRDIHSVNLLIDISNKYCWENKSIIKINDTGKLIWNCLDECSDIDSLLGRIFLAYHISDTDKDTVANDVNMFLQYLRQLGYVNYEL